MRMATTDDGVEEVGHKSTHSFESGGSALIGLSLHLLSVIDCEWRET
jgi:hypothetical protein